MALYSGRILVRRGDEINYDPEKLMPGEWALSTDKKIVRICVSPGETIRMATYDAFEEDMKKIEEILATCQSIQEAVIRINTEISQKADAVAEYTAQAKQYRDEAKQFRDEAETFAPSGYSELVENVEKNTVKIDTVIEKADLRIKETASGESIHLTDSADAKVVEFTLYGKAKQETTTGAQLFNYDAWKNVRTLNGTSVFENNGVTISATSNDAYTNYYDFPENAKIFVNEGDVITLSWEESSNKVGATCIFPNGDASKIVYVYNNETKSITYTVPPGVTYLTFRFGVKNAGDTISYKNIMINKGSTPLPYEPYTGGQPSPNPYYKQDVEISGASGSIVVKSCGKNLLKNTAESTTVDGLTVTVNEDKSVKITGSLDTAQIKDVYINGSYGGTKNILPIKKGKIFIKDTVVPQNPNVIMHVITPGSRVLGTTNGQDLSLEIENGITAIMYRFSAGVTYDLTLYPMIRRCDENDNPIGDDTYEPYKETSSTIPTPNGLAGINVDSSGNYTDENGQQRVCDVIVKYADGSGEKIQKIEKKIFDGSEDEGWRLAGSNTSGKYRVATDSLKNVVENNSSNGNRPNILCTNYVKISPNESYDSIYDKHMGITVSVSGEILVYDKNYNTNDISLWKTHLAQNPMTLYYELAQPIRTPLTEEQIAEIEKLCTFYPETNIYNDADCGMGVTHIVDAKRYIDNKIAELATAMVNSI